MLQVETSCKSSFLFRAFYAFKSSLFYNHCNHESDVIVIPFVMGTCQSDPLGRGLFALAHFKALHSTTSHFPSCLFSYIANDIHIIGPPFIVSFAYEHFKTKLHAICFSIQSHKCVAWSPFGLPSNFNTPSQFTTPSEGIRVLGIPLDISSFTSSFNKDALLKNV